MTVLISERVKGAKAACLLINKFSVSSLRFSENGKKNQNQTDEEL